MDYYLGVACTQEPYHSNDIWLAYIYTSSMKQALKDTMPAGYIDIISGMDEATVVSRAKKEYTNIIIEYSEGELEGRYI